MSHGTITHTSAGAGNSTNSGTGSTKMTIVIAALTLFSMFFGAGNLIFPPMVGVQAGTNFWPAIAGFLAAGVLLPVLAIVAVAISGNNVRDLASRGGAFFGIAFSVLAYLAIGAFYALPRTGAVSMETAITPLTGWDGQLASGVFNTVFFLVALAFTWRPNSIIDALGRFLTPALVILLALLIVLALVNFDRLPATPADAYAAHPMATGLFEGYNTMDAIAGLAFGIVIISSLRAKGFGAGGHVVRGTVITSVIAGVLLGAIYLGLGYVAQTIPNGQSYESGAALLADSARFTMGTAGQVIFSLIVLLACLTTAVGLISATSEFFTYLLPKVSYHTWAVLFTAMSIAMAFRGLDAVLAVAVPFIVFLYPPAIVLIALSIIQPMVSSRLAFHWTYRLALWTAVMWSALSTFADLGVAALSPVLELSPGQEQSLGWVVPTLIALIIGLVMDATMKTGLRAPTE